MMVIPTGFDFNPTLVSFVFTDVKVADTDVKVANEVKDRVGYFL